MLHMIHRGIKVKARVPSFLSAIILSSLLAGCVSMKVPKAEDVLDVGPLATILAYVSDVPLGESGRTAEALTINVGGTVYFTAQGRDGNNKPIKISPTWTPSSPDVVEISPKTGQAVAVKGLRPGTVDIVVEFKGVKRTLQFISVR
ncbi:MAG: hypothetical protein NT005_05830 [Spirochaetes bacterium]|nr:hypothetical protein [Spirochaetota bacterium]